MAEDDPHATPVVVINAPPSPAEEEGFPASADLYGERVEEMRRKRISLMSTGLVVDYVLVFRANEVGVCCGSLLCFSFSHSSLAFFPPILLYSDLSFLALYFSLKQ